MKYLRYIFASIVLALMATACDDDKNLNPAFDDDEMPYIYMDWAGTYVYKLGDVVKFTAQVSPLEGTDCRWLVNGNVVSETPSIEWTISDAEPFTLRFEAERNGIVNYRTAQVTVAKDFEPKTYDKAVMGVVTTDATSDMVQWDYITHLMVSSLTVSDESGTLNLPGDASLATLKTLVSLAHNNGVYVIIDISGTINFPAGTGVYNETALNAVAIDPDKRAKLIADIKKFVDEYELDGVNIYVNNLNNDAGGLLPDKDGLTAFFNELGETFPAEREAPYNRFFLTASVPMAWNNYEFYFLGGAPRLDWINLMLFGGTDLSPVQHAPDWQINDNIARFRDSAGIPASKMMVGVAAFGVNYDIPAGTDVTWGNLDSFLTYPLYKDIVKMAPDATAKSEMTIGSASMFYTGLTAAENSIDSKAAIVKDNDAMGMFIWTADYDTQDPATSITQAVWNHMN